MTAPAVTKEQMLDWVMRAGRQYNDQVADAVIAQAIRSLIASSPEAGEKHVALAYRKYGDFQVIDLYDQRKEKGAELP